MKAEGNTKDRILDAAESLFSDRGFDGVSIRSIVRLAGVNTAAVHYHFGSKEALIEAVLARRAAPINRERLARLDALEKSHPEGPLPLEGVIEAFVAPVLQARSRLGREHARLPLVIAKAFSETDEGVGHIVHRTFGEVFDRFRAAFRRALPHLPDDERTSRIHFMIGVMSFTLLMPQSSPFASPSRDQGDYELLLKRMVRFMAAGMRAKALTPSRTRIGSPDRKGEG